MNGLAASVIWLTAICLPYLLFVVRNDFTQTGVIVVRALFAIGLGWIYVVAAAVAVNALTTVELSLAAGAVTFAEGDGAKLSFSVVFGWTLPLCVVAIAWGSHAWKARRKSR